MAGFNNVSLDAFAPYIDDVWDMEERYGDIVGRRMGYTSSSTSGYPQYYLDGKLGHSIGSDLSFYFSFAPNPLEYFADFTLAFWLYTGVTYIDEQIATIKIAGDGFERRVIVNRGSSGQVEWHDDNGVLKSWNSSTTVSDGEWHHFMIVRDNGTIVAYHNGALMTGGGYADGTDFYNADDTSLHIGFSLEGESFGDPVRLDQIVSWRVALDAAARSALYNNGSGRVYQYDQKITVPVIAVPVALVVPCVSLKVLMPVITISATVVEPDVSCGAASIAAPVITETVTVIPPAAVGSVKPSWISVPVVVVPPAVTVGDPSVCVPIITEPLTVVAPTVVAGAVTVTCATITETVTVVAPTVTQSMSAPVISVAVSVVPPVAAITGKSVVMPVITVPITPTAPSIVCDVSVTVPEIEAPVTVVVPTVLCATSVTAPVIVAEVTIIAPTIKRAAAVGVSLLRRYLDVWDPQFFGRDHKPYVMGLGASLGRAMIAERGSYLLYRSEGAEPDESSAIVVGAAAPTAVQPGRIAPFATFSLSPDTVYWFWMHAVSPGGAEENKPAMMVRIETDGDGLPLPLAPNAPIRLAVTTLAAGYLRLNWRHNRGGEQTPAASWNVYHDNGTGTVDYDNVLANTSSMIYKAGPYSHDTSVKFVVRAVSRDDVEETNTTIATGVADNEGPADLPAMVLTAAREE